MEEKLLEEKILKSFRKYEGEEVKDLELFVSIDEDCWSEGEYTCEVLETKFNGRVWFVECTKSGNVKETYEL